MKASTANRHTVSPVTKVWVLAKDLDYSQKLELVSMLIESVKPAVSKNHEGDEVSPQKRYTMDELNAMLDEAEAEIAVGGGISHEEVMREWDEEIARWEQEEREMALAEIINGLSKLVYRIDDDVIHIVAFWDTRMEPEHQAAQVK